MNRVEDGTGCAALKSMDVAGVTACKEWQA